MRIVIYGRRLISNDFPDFFRGFIKALDARGIEAEVVDTFAGFIQKNYQLECKSCAVDQIHPSRFDCLISLGGDGTVLDTLALVRDTGLPVMGINLGRFGFLSNIPEEGYEAALDALVRGEYEIDKRTVLQVDADIAEMKEFPYALNDFVVQKRDSSAMITVKAFYNNDYLNSYWSDGLIVATPTGSSGYSLSCGGPLLFPGSRAFVLTPIAAHNLTVRPAVLSDDHPFKFQVSSRSESMLVSLDSRSFKVPAHTELTVKRAPFLFHMIQLKGTTYMDTIRQKLMWGLDSRNKPK